MDRRAFIALALSLLVAPLAADGQPAGKVYRIGILGNVPLTNPQGARLWGAFTQGLRELGYVEGQNVAFEHRSSEGEYERLPDLAADLVRLNVDVIVAPATNAPFAAKQAWKWVGDCYLLACAKLNQATLVTFDTALQAYARKQGNPAVMPG